MSVAPKVRVLMVCMGNICRSPSAEGVLRQRLAARGLADLVEVDSAGTHAYHIGNPPDERSQAHAARRGYDLGALRARRVTAADYEAFDYLLAMDWDNLALLEGDCPPEQRGKLGLLMRFARQHTAQTVPDPYYGGDDGFERVLDYLEDACDGLIEAIEARRRRD